MTGEHGAPGPRRSVLYMPGHNERALTKAQGLACDALILDLEDSVGPDHKEAARDQVCSVVANYPHHEVTIRINSAGTPWHDADLRAACAAGPAAIVVPKVDSADAAERLAERLADAPDHTQLWAMIETPRGVQDVDAIAAVPRVGALVIGANDLLKELGAQYMPDRENLAYHLSRAVNAARAADIDCIDAVFNDVKDLAGFTREAEHGWRFGCAGKTLIHPAQIDPCNQVYSPTPEAVNRAQQVVDAWNSPQRQGRGVVTVDGRMIEQLHVTVAEQTLALAEHIGRRAELFSST